MSAETLRFSPLAGALGAEVAGVDLTQPVGDAVFAELEQGLSDHQVLVFRDQDLSPEAHKAFGQRFGVLDTHPVLPHLEGHPEVVVLDSAARHPPVEEWHTDVTYERAPPLGSMLLCQEMPAAGGDTLFASLSAAYEGLSDAMQRLVSGLVAEHSFVQGYRHTLRAPGAYDRYRDAIAARPPAQHPVVRTHPVSGRKGLFVNGLFTTHIVGMSELESNGLLQMLYAHITTPEYTCRVRWQKHTLTFWDNRITQHRPINDFLPARRRMQRVVIRGDVPA